MEIFLIVIFSILIILSYIGYVFNADNVGGSIFVICIMLFSVMLGIVAQQEKDSRKPQAIDVYRGKTTLKITYQNNIAVDSIVVYKNK